ncbi:MAG: dihydroneopterin aldolase [Sphingobacteriales bacterium]|nr:MAG: dihydroneopterin aldolase [Sphingobacteriales bacterium]
MTPFFTIALEGLLFHAPHGVYAGEAVTGNDFEVDLRMEVAAETTVTQIGQTVNYAEVYALLRGIFLEREALLETLCQKVAAALESAYPHMQRLEISIRKLTPAIAHFQGSVRVSYTKAYNHPRP